MCQKTIKKLMRYHLLIVALVFSTITSCEVLEKSDECEKFALEEINVRLTPDIRVFLVDEGQKVYAVDYKVTIDIHKEYCNGDISGTFSKTTTTDEMGRANFSQYYTYKMDNSFDEIYITYTAKQGDNIKNVKKILLNYDEFQHSPIDDWGFKVFPMYEQYEIIVEP